MALRLCLKSFVNQIERRSACSIPIYNPAIVFTQTRKKHWNQKFRRERAKKVLKIKLPDFDEERRQGKVPVEVMKAKMKEKGMTPFRQWSEKGMHISCLGAIVDAYVPPEGDSKMSIISTPGVKQTYDTIGKKSKSYLALRKIRNLDYEFDVPTVADLAKDIYIDALTALANNNEAKLHDIVTEKAFPELMENVKNKVIKWNFIRTLEPSRIVHIRCQEMISKENLFAQITVRLFSEQKVAIYDRFGRLMYGSEDVSKNVLEYVVFEKHLSNQYGAWRIHGKIVPEWLPPKEPIRKTFILPVVETNVLESPINKEVAEVKPEPPLENVA